MNPLYRRGADVIYEKVSEIHVSGHASQEELKIMMNLVKPEYFIPVHGEYRHLVLHSRLARKVGIPEEKIVIAEDGDVVEFTEKGAAKRGKVEYGRVFVDGKGVGDVGAMVIKDRSHLSQDGLVVVVMAINSATGETVYGPEIMTKGLVFEEESAVLLAEARASVVKALENVSAEARTEQLEVEEEMRRALRRFFNKKLKRRPVILPVIIEI